MGLFLYHGGTCMLAIVIHDPGVGKILSYCVRELQNRLDRLGSQATP